jgi:hypothetical protein
MRVQPIYKIESLGFCGEIRSVFQEMETEANSE